AARLAVRDALGETIEGEINDRCREQGQDLADQESSNDADSQRVPELGAGAGAEHEGQGAEDRRDRGHEDGAEAQQAGLVDGLAWAQALFALGIDGEVDHEDRVLLDDANEQNDADEGDDGEVIAGENEREQGPDPGRGQGRENRDRMYEALVQNAQ